MSHPKTKYLNKYKLTLVRESRAYDEPRERIKTPAAMAKILINLIGSEPRETLVCVCLDTKNAPISIVTIYTGSLNAAILRTAEVFTPAIIHNAASIILAHNHPSGCTDPSVDDIATTNKIIKAGKLLDVELLDHIIVTHDNYLSIRETGRASF